MKKILFLLFYLLLFNACDLDIIKHKYADWETLMNAPENEKGWFPPLFKDNLLLKNNIFDIILINDLDTNNVWGKFSYSNSCINDLPIKMNTYINNYEDAKYMWKLDFDNSKISLYFTEIQEEHNRKWYYLINANENIVYFNNFERWYNNK